jgi:hypothetical protein
MKTVIFLDKNATVDRLFIVCGPRGSVAEPQGMSDRHVTNIIYVLCICISTKKEKNHLEHRYTPSILGTGSQKAQEARHGPRGKVVFRSQMHFAFWMFVF